MFVEELAGYGSTPSPYWISLLLGRSLGDCQPVSGQYKVRITYWRHTFHVLSHLPRQEDVRGEESHLKVRSTVSVTVDLIQTPLTIVIYVTQILVDYSTYLAY